jgi:segregation and condensation protein B
MSLKAKLEAVIYAAEEPVTLAQLASIFTADALELKAERAAAAAAVVSTPVAATQPLLDEGFAYLGLEQEPAYFTAPQGEDGGLPVATPDGIEAAPDTAPEAGADSHAPVKHVAPESVDTTEEPAHPPAQHIEAPAASAQSATAESSAAAAEPAPESAPPADTESDLKREARQRDREVRSILEGLIEELKADYATDGRGIEIREIAGGYRMATKPECHDAVRIFIRSLKPPLKLSLQALETLAVVAYKQPVTAPEVAEIRGVESAGTLGSLLSRKLVATAGRKQVIGRPILYKTTREFLLRFGLKDISELPSMEEFEKMAAIELEEPAASAEGAEAAETAAGELGEELVLDNSVEENGEQAAAEAEPAATESATPESTTQPAESNHPAETEATPHGQ